MAKAVSRSRAASEAIFAAPRRPVIGRGMYGMFGPLTDPGERVFSAAVERLGVEIGRSPYRDYEVNQIVADFNNAPANAIRLLWGSSLGANNCPVVVAYAAHVVIHGMWGFQASDFGSQVPIRSNALFAHEVYNPNISLGAYEWVKASGNHVTNLHVERRDDFHPGETPQVMAIFLAEMKQVIAQAQGSA